MKSDPTERFHGVVKFFDVEKGYGFLKSSAGTIHIGVGALKRIGLECVDAGAEVYFRVREHPGGRTSAIDVELIKHAPPETRLAHARRFRWRHLSSGDA